VRVRLGRASGQVQHAEVVRQLAPSLHRVPGLCEVDACQNCDLKHLALPAQADLKRRRIVEALRRIGKLDVEGLLGPVRQRGDGWRSRHRVRLHAVFDHNRWQLGYFARRSRVLVPLRGCPILWPELEEVVQGLVESLTGLAERAGLVEVEVVYSRRDGGAVLRLTGVAGELLGDWAGKLLSPVLRAVVVETPTKTTVTGDPELRYDHGREEEFDLCFEPGVFTQANPEMNSELVDAVVQAAGPMKGRRLMELHAGIGNFSIPLALAGVEVTATEGEPQAVRMGRKNAEAAKAPITVLALSDEQAVAELEGFQAVLLDPPRAGARAAVAAIAKRTAVERVVYVACDPATLARDAGILVDGGFGVVGAQAFDMFPQTSHVETLLVFER
jgi:23S rRNA (uracil1939-C5)-methyltransferase